MNDEERRQVAINQIKRYRGDFSLFAEQNLRIRDKNSEIIPFKVNKAQQYALEQFEAQIAKTGKVRAIILKGRQQGISTLVEGWYYWKTSLNKHKAAYILSHEQSSADSIFGMVDRFHRLNPIAPSTGASNSKELAFDVLGSKYIVATAGAKAGGRGQAATTYFHGSEVAFWPNAQDHFASSVQSVPDLAGTAIVLESTANGASGEFYERWLDAQNGKSDYAAIFVPWYWQDEYQRQPEEGFVLLDEPDDAGVSEAQYAEMYGLSDAQMAWRRAKISELRSSAKFRQEYPATPSEAFIASSDESFIPPHLVMRARKRSDIAGYGPLIVGADPAGSGGDRFAVAIRQGACVERVEWRDKIDGVAAAQWLRSIVIERKPARLFVDAGGMGNTIISILRSWPETAAVVSAVNFGGTSEHKNAKPKVPGPKNRRAEMWQRLKDWLELEEGVSLPDMDVLSSDITAPKVKPNLTNDLVLEAKDDMRKRGVRSPDLADAIALTFASMLYVPVEKTPPANPVEFKDDVVNTDPAMSMRDNFSGGSHDSWMG